MTQATLTNNFSTTLASPVASTDTSISILSATNFPTLNTGDVIPLIIRDAATQTLWEIVYGTAISGTSVTVERGKEGTTAQSWNSGDKIFCGPTIGAQDLRYGTVLADYTHALSFIESSAAINGQTVSIASSDGGPLWNVVTGAALNTYTSNGNGYCGTIIASTDGSAALLSVDTILSDIRKWGAKCDGIRYEDGVISGASFNQLSSASYTFTSADVGKTIFCQTLVSGYPSHLEATTISSVSSGVATLSGASTKAYSDVVFYMGTDDTTAVTNAQAYAASIQGPLYFPPGNCLLMSGNQYVTVSSGVEYYGDGPSSCVVSGNNAFNNDGLTTSSQGSLTQYPVNDITAGDDGFTTTTAADAANFSDGQLVWVNSTGNTSGVPYFGQLCKVVSVNTSTGFVGVEGAFEDSYTSMQVCAAPSTIPEGATIHDLKIVTSHMPWNSGGAYRCNVRNVHLDASTVWAANAQTYCRYENISGRVWAGGNDQGRLSEFALNSYNSHLRGLNVQVVLRDTVSGQTALFIEHENSRGCTWSGIDVEAPQLSATVLDTSSSLRAALIDYRISLNSCPPGYLLYFYNNQSPPTVGGVTKMDHRSTGGRVKVLSGYQYGVGINAVAGSTLDGVFVDDVIVDGDASVSPGYSVFYTGTGTIQNTRVLNSVIDGYEQIGSGAYYNNLISNLTSRGAQQPSVATNGGLKYVNCIRSGLATVPKNARIDYGTVTSTTANNPALTYSIPASVELHQGDKIRMRLRGQCQTGTYTASFMVNIDGTTFGGTFTISPAGSAINFDAEAILTLVSGTYTAPDHFSGVVSYNNGFTPADAVAYLPVTVGAAHTIEWQVWISSGTGTVALQDAFIELIPVELA